MIEFVFVCLVITAVFAVLGVVQLLVPPECVYGFSSTTEKYHIREPHQ